MWPYFFLIIAIFLLQFRFNDNRKENFRFYVGVGILFLFAALRGVSNGDYDVYLTRGKWIDSINKIFENNTNMEVGYSVLYYFINLLHLPEQSIIISMNLISLSCITIFVNRYSPNRCLSLLLFFPLYFQFDMQAARNAVAISISVMCIPYVCQRRFLRFCLTVFFATLFHRSAVIIFPIYFLYGLRVNLFLGLTSILAAMCFVRFIGMDRMVLWTLKTLGLTSFYVKYYGYVNSIDFGYSFSLLDPRLWLCIFVYLVSKYILKNASKLENFFVNCSLANVLIMILFSEHTIFCCRLSAFWYVYSIVLIPLVLKRIYTSQYDKNRNAAISNHRQIGLATAAFYAIYAMVYAYVCFISLGLNYKLFFQV